MTVRAIRIKSMSKAVNKILPTSFPPIFEYRPCEKPVYAPQKEKDHYLINDPGDEDSRLFPEIRSGMDRSYDRFLFILIHMAYLTILTIQWLFLSMNGQTLMASNAVVLAVILTEVLFSMGPDLQGRKPREITGFSGFHRMAFPAGLFKLPPVNGRSPVLFAENSVFTVAGMALRSFLPLSRQTVPVFLIMAFITLHRARPFRFFMSLVRNPGMAVFARQLTSVCGALKGLHGYMERTILTPLPVTGYAILGCVGPHIER
jgi:hypothetical protein